MLKNTTEIPLDSLLNAVAARHPNGFRFVTITCTDLGETFDLLYHFDKDYILENLRVKLPKGTPLPSISHIYFAAVIVENEMKDLFGLDITGLAIDYEGKFLLSDGSPKAPMCKAAPVAQPPSAVRSGPDSQPGAAGLSETGGNA
jgi:NADH:ubiquinone oxidoreductase subunit C